MNNVNTIIIMKKEYDTNEDFENAIKKAITCLLDNDYIMTVSYDEKGLGIVQIDFNHRDRVLGYDYPFWLSQTEIESVRYDTDTEEEKIL